jgi:aminopeptidase N
MYFKGSNMIHTIRQVINDDQKFRQILRGLNQTFYHQTVTSEQIEDYIIQQSGKDLKPIFNQYLRHTQIPTLEVKTSGNGISFRWTNCIPEFNMPVRLTNGKWLQPTTSWKNADMNLADVDVDKNFYIYVRK